MSHGDSQAVGSCLVFEGHGGNHSIAILRKGRKTIIFFSTKIHDFYFAKALF